MTDVLLITYMPQTPKEALNTATQSPFRGLGQTTNNISL